jgi:hypothetical protein
LHTRGNIGLVNHIEFDALKPINSQAVQKKKNYKPRKQGIVSTNNKVKYTKHHQI